MSRFDTAVQCFNGRVGAGNTPTVRAKVGQDVALHVYGGDGNFHTFHVHGHRWVDRDGRDVDTQTVGPAETIAIRWREEDPGTWLYHCHVESHMMAGMIGIYRVSR